mgnify:CR=1 FL=1
MDAKPKTEDYEPARPTDGRGFDRNPSGSSMRLYPGELRSEVIRSGSAAPVIGIPSPGGPAQAPSVRPVESGGASLSPIAVEAPTGLWKSPNNTARPTEAAPTQVVSPLPFQRSRIAENPRESRRLDRFVTSRSKVVETPKPGGQVGEAVHKAFARTPTLNAQSSQSKLLSPFLAVPEDESADESTLMTSPSDRLSASNASQVIVPATRAAQAQVSIMRQVAEALSSVQDDTIELQLDPEELGRVQFRMVHAEHGLVLNIIAERPETLDPLRRHAEQLSQHFAHMGYSGAEFSFQEQGQGGEERSGLGGESAPSVDADTVPDHSIQTMAPMEGLDIRI